MPRRPGPSSPVPCRPPARPGCDRSPRVALALLALLAVAGVAAGPRVPAPGPRHRVRRAAAVGRGRPRVERAGDGVGLGGGHRRAPARGATSARRSRSSDALALDRPRVLVPASMPAPDAAYVIGAGDRRIVTLAWRAEPGQATARVERPRADGDGGAGDVDDALITKIATRGHVGRAGQRRRRPGLVDLGCAARAADRAARRPGRVDPRRDRGRHAGVRARRDALPAGVVPRAGRDRRHRRGPALIRPGPARAAWSSGRRAAAGRA